MLKGLRGCIQVVQAVRWNLAIGRGTEGKVMNVFVGQACRLTCPEPWSPAEEKGQGPEEARLGVEALRTSALDISMIQNYCFFIETHCPCTVYKTQDTSY